MPSSAISCRRPSSSSPAVVVRSVCVNEMRRRRCMGRARDYSGRSMTGKRAYCAPVGAGMRFRVIAQHQPPHYLLRQALRFPRAGGIRGVIHGSGTFDFTAENPVATAFETCRSDDSALDYSRYVWTTRMHSSSAKISELHAAASEGMRRSASVSSGVMRPMTPLLVLGAVPRSVGRTKSTDEERCRRSRLTLGGVTAFLILTLACGGGGGRSTPTAPTPAPTPSPTVTSVIVNGPGCAAAVCTGTVGATLQLTATAQLSNSTAQSVTSQAQWASSSPNVATVNNAGLVNFRAAGDSDITATYQGQQGE